LTADHTNRLNRRITAIRRSDVHALYTARAARGVGDRFAIIILPAYLPQLVFGPFQIGLVASTPLLGTAIVTLAIGFLAAYKDLSF
jgi:hypothetical protein